MRPLRSSLVACLLLMLTTAPMATAQDGMVQDEAWVLRGAVGDIPTTDAPEATDAWNLAETHRVTHDGGSQVFSFTPLPGYDGVDLRCSCSDQTIQAGEDGTYRFTFNSSIEEGVHDLTFTQNIPVDADHAFPILVPTVPQSARSDAAVVFYVPGSLEVRAFLPDGLEPDAVLPAVTKAGFDIYRFRGTDGAPFPDTMQFTASPASTSAAPVRTDGGFDFLALAIGILAGMLVWSILVGQGMVQKRRRKQVAGPAAHAEEARSDSPEVLAGRKRALMAALKELEVAKMNKELDPEVYDQLKARFKKETVTVMRALEERQTEG